MIFERDFACLESHDNVGGFDVRMKLFVKTRLKGRNWMYLLPRDGSWQGLGSVSSGPPLAGVISFHLQPRGLQSRAIVATRLSSR